MAVSKEHDHDTGSSRKPPHMQHYNPNRCLECEVKDAEIWTLRKRIQVIKEVVELPNQKLSAIQQSSNSVLFSPMVMAPVVSEVVIPSTYTTPPTTSVKVREAHCCTSVDEALQLKSIRAHFALRKSAITLLYCSQFRKAHITIRSASVVS